MGENGLPTNYSYAFRLLVLLAQSLGYSGDSRLAGVAYLNACRVQPDEIQDKIAAKAAGEARQVMEDV